MNFKPGDHVRVAMKGSTSTIHGRLVAYLPWDQSVAAVQKVSGEMIRASRADLHPLTALPGVKYRNRQNGEVRVGLTDGQLWGPQYDSMVEVPMTSDWSPL